MQDFLILATVFTAVFLLTLPVMSYFSRRREVAEKLSSMPSSYHKLNASEEEKLNELIGSDNQYIRHYFDITKTKNKDAIEFRLIRAGFFNPTAAKTFQRVRAAVGVVVFVLSAYIAGEYFPQITPVFGLLLAAIVSGISFILANAYLDRLGKLRQTSYRKLFPDFMDLLIVCVDAGLSIEAAIDRVMREFLNTNRDFGTHLAIISLEVRAGRALRDALSNFADRINVEEARSLAILFKQSEELGSSITKTLRTYSHEMREARMIRAEEKANALPVKMLFPLALFLFPTNLIIVIVPIGISIVKMFIQLAPT
jgi:tight adherence protein C